jgi:hypothetical protein
VALTLTTAGKDQILQGLFGYPAYGAPYSINNKFSGAFNILYAGATPLNSGTTSTDITYATPTGGVASATASSATTCTVAGSTIDGFQLLGATGTLLASGTAGALNSGADLCLTSTTSVTGTRAQTVSAAQRFAFPSTNSGTLRMNSQLTNAAAGSILFGTNHPQIFTNQGGAFTLDIYTGTQPTDADTAVGAQTKVGTIYVTSAAWMTTPSSGIITSLSFTITQIASGTATWARWSRGSHVLDMSVGTTGADLILPTTTFTGSGTVVAGDGAITLTLP